ncbi:hypothetical protein ACGFY9_41355 [Streptomyces sp. NPDC048504]
MAVIAAALVTGLALLPDTFPADADASARERHEGVHQPHRKG